jgi:hypothetical protein
MAYRIQAAAGAALCWLFIGCAGGEKDDFEFSESDMRAAVAGNWSGTIDSTGESVLVQIVEHGTALSASSSTAGKSVGESRQLTSCSRQFGNRGLRCMPMTSMGIDGSISSAQNTLPQATLTGTFDVDGNELEYGQLHLANDNGNDLQGTFSSGQFSRWFYSTSTGATFTLDLAKQ